MRRNVIGAVVKVQRAMEFWYPGRFISISMQNMDALVSNDTERHGLRQGQQMAKKLMILQVSTACRANLIVAESFLLMSIGK